MPRAAKKFGDTTPVATRSARASQQVKLIWWNSTMPSKLASSCDSRRLGDRDGKFCWRASGVAAAAGRADRFAYGSGLSSTP